MRITVVLCVFLLNFLSAAIAVQRVQSDSLSNKKPLEDTSKILIKKQPIKSKGLQSISVPIKSKFPANSIQQYLKGNVAGLFATEASGEPGTYQHMFIHGTSTPLITQEDVLKIQPLVVIDGLPVLSSENPYTYDIQRPDYSFNRIGPSTNLLAGLNIADIESVEVLKDLSKTAIYYKLSGEAESEGDALGGNFLSVIILSTFLFIAVLLLQFKTFKGIIIVLSIIPLGILGGVVLLLLTGNPMSMVSIIGFIGLSGIQVKNSLLLVDFTNQLRMEGHSIDEAIAIAGETRFLPVVLTSITAICGLLPIALNPNPLIAPLAIVLIGGLISSTILSRIVTPVMYKLIPPNLESDTHIENN